MKKFVNQSQKTRKTFICNTDSAGQVICTVIEPSLAKATQKTVVNSSTKSNQVTSCGPCKRGLKNNKVFILRQCDFATGTYRIKCSGTYKLVENIVFNPPFGSASLRPDTPINGFWFAIISVEIDDVEILGQGFDFTVSSTYMDAYLVGSFSELLFGNNQFAGSLFGGGGVQYPDTTAYVAANNVTVRNLNVVGAGSHFGMMGNNNNNIYIDNCTISDCQVVNFYGQGIQTLEITNTLFTGSTTPIIINMEITQLILMREQLANFIADGVPGAAAQLAALEAYVLANPARFNPPPQDFPTSNYGIFLTTGATAIFPFPMTSCTIPITEAFADGRNGENVYINNCTFDNFTSDFFEVVDIGSNVPLNTPIGCSPPPILATWPLVIFGTFGSLQWKDAFDSLGNFAPNAFLQSLTFITNFVYGTFPPSLQALVPANSLQIFDSILNSNEAEFNANAAPIVSAQSDGTPNAKGLFGMRLVGQNNIRTNNIRMTNFNSTGPKPIDPTTLPGYENLASPLPAERSRGNDAWFCAFEVCKNVTSSNHDNDTINSVHGYVFNTDLANECANVTISSSSVINMSAPNTDINLPTLDAGDVNGFVVEDETAGIIFENLTTTNLTGGGTVTQFSPPSGTVTLINCFSF